MAVGRIPGGGVGRNPFGVEWASGDNRVNETLDATQDPLFGRRRPDLVEPDPESASLLARLHVYRRRLARLAGDDESDYDLALARGTIAMIDAQGLIYIGREFLLAYADALDVQVGVIAHEIGHRPRRWQTYRSGRKLAPSELHDLCRLEETRADYFAGYALGHLRMDCEPLCAFLEAVEDGPHPEYFSASLRAETIREAYAAGQRRLANVKKFFPEFARQASASSDFGTL